jgi:FixJ family two-component response regulator
MNEKKPIHVAVVDDDGSFARSISHMLRTAGFDVVSYSSAEAFLTPTPLPKPDCIVLDITLTGMSGLELRQRLNALGATTPVIFVTSHAEPEIRELTNLVGCSAFFRKPVPEQLLLAAIQHAVTPQLQ